MSEIIDDFRNLMLKFQEIIEVIEVPVFNVEKYAFSRKIWTIGNFNSTLNMK